MNLRQQIIQDRIEKTATSLGVVEDVAFLRFTHSVITGQSTHAFDPSDLTDGGQEKQIDTITIEQSNDEVNVYIIQTKNSGSFSSNQLILMRNGLDWIFNKPRADLNTLSNMSLKDKIVEYRSVQSGSGPSNIHVIVAFITNGLTADLSDEFKQEAKSIRDQYDNGTFASFSLEIWGADELVERINALERKNRKIDADIRIRYDTNNPSLIRYHADELKGIVCSASAKEIAKIVNNDSDGYVFDLNIRRFLGTRGGVNSDILKTCGSTDVSRLFWFLNNGITVVCDSCDAVTDPDNPHVKIRNMQIVNGCQTATSLALADRNGQLASDVRVLLRIYETTDPELVSKIVLTTNNQNQISSRDLRSNDTVQLDMERGFATYGYAYERKPRQYDGQAGASACRIVANETVGQSFLAIVLRRPSDARARKYKIWGELYGQVFGGAIVEPYIISEEIYRCAVAWLRRVGYTAAHDDVRRKLSNVGVFHIARAAAYLWRGNDVWKADVATLKAQIDQLQHQPSELDCYLEDAVTRLEGIIRSSPVFLSDLDNALKSSALDAAIDKSLYSAK